MNEKADAKNTRYPTLEVGTVRLCGVQGCCPTINFDDPNYVIIKDDFGGKIKFTRGQWQEMKIRFSTF